MENGSWEKIYVEQGEVQRHILNTVIEAKNLFKSKGYNKVLDLGCGTGRNTIYLAYNGFEVWASDISKKGVEITEQRANELGLENIHYGIEDMFNLTYNDSLFDAILCIWVQGHGKKEDIQRSIDEQYRVLRRGGMVVSDFVSVDDSTYGIGEKIAENTFVGGRSGEEGIPHYYTHKDELYKMFHTFNQVNLIPRVYTFEDDWGNEHKIDAIVVQAIK